MIVGEDGGMYMLMNNLRPENEHVISEAVGADYLKDKIKVKPRITEPADRVTIEHSML